MESHKQSKSGNGQAGERMGEVVTSAVVLMHGSVCVYWVSRHSRGWTGNSRRAEATDKSRETAATRTHRMTPLPPHQMHPPRGPLATSSTPPIQHLEIGWNDRRGHGIPSMAGRLATGLLLSGSGSADFSIDGLVSFR
jgi:hypothetical protein